MCRVVVLVAAFCAGVLLGGCASATNKASGENVHYFSPPGVSIPSNQASDNYDGLYLDATQSQCCWVAPSATLHVRVTPETKAIALSIYIPDLPIFKSDPQQLMIRLGSDVKRYCCFGPGNYSIALKPQANTAEQPIEIISSTVDVPVDQGINGDVRKLAFILSRITLLKSPSKERLPKSLLVSDGNDKKTYFYPAGVIASSSNRIDGGIYGVTASEPQCCWLSPVDNVAFNKAAGASTLYLTIYEPNIAPITDHRQGLSVTFPDGRIVERCCFGTDERRIPIPLPDDIARRGGVIRMKLALRTSWVPQQLGLNSDARQLAGILKQVDAH